jgi:hypothetical protein
MSLRDDIEVIVRSELNKTQFGYEAAQAALAGERAWGTQQAVNDMLVAYCSGLENAILRIADEVEAISD